MTVSSKAAILAIGVCAFAIPKVAVGEIVFSDSMDYSDNAALRATWQRAGTPGSEASRATTFTATTVTTVQTPVFGTHLAMANGLVYAELPSPVTGSFKLRFKMLDTSYSRSSHLAMMDVSGRFGYGVRWNTNQATQFGGRGSLTLTKLAFASAWTWANPFDHGTALGTPTNVGSNHPATGYAVSAVGPPVVYSSVFVDFADFELGWDSQTGVLSLRQNELLLMERIDHSFAPIFSRLYFYGNTTSVLDEVELESVTSSEPLPPESDGNYGAHVAFVTLEAEAPASTVSGGAVIQATKSQLGTSPPTAAQEASGRGYVQLNNAGNYVQFPGVPAANAMVIRHCIPDAPEGGGITATLGLYVNGVFRQTVTLSSKYNWLYAETSDSDDNGQSNTPTAFPHVYWDETRLFINGGVQAGDSIRLQKDAGDTAAYYRIDLVDLEWVPAPLAQPPNSLSVIAFGANGEDDSNDSTAFNNCINAAVAQGKTVWIPPGKFRLHTDLPALNGVKVQGAGMWYSELYHNGTGSGTFRFFRMTGEGATVSDVYMDSLTQTSRSEFVAWPFSGTGTGWTIENCWMTHTGVGMWLAGFDGRVSGCRVRFTYADGININNGSALDTDVVLVEDNHVRGVGDDSIAVLSFENEDPGETRNIVVRHNTTVSPWWGSSLALGGGRGHLIENNQLLDGAGFILNLPSAYPKYPITGAVFRNNLLVRCGRNLAGQKRGAIWTNAGYAQIGGMHIEGNVILDPIYRGIHSAGSAVQHIVFRGNLIDSPGEDGIVISSTAEGVGVYDTNEVRNLKPGFDALDNSSANYAVFAIDASSYYNWRFEHFSSADFSDIDIVGNSADPEGDGRPNTAEYGLGTDPSVADFAPGQPLLSVEDDRLVFSFIRPDGREDMNYDVEWSADMVNWVGYPDSEAMLQPPVEVPVAGGTRVEVESVDTMQGSPPPFLRLWMRRE